MSLKELSSGKHSLEGRKPRRLPRLQTPVGLERRGKTTCFHTTKEGVGALGAERAAPREGSRGEKGRDTTSFFTELWGN